VGRAGWGGGEGFVCRGVGALGKFLGADDDFCSSSENRMASSSEGVDGPGMGGFSSPGVAMTRDLSSEIKI